MHVSLDLSHVVYSWRRSAAASDYSNIRSPGRKLMARRQLLLLHALVYTHASVLSVPLIVIVAVTWESVHPFGPRAESSVSGWGFWFLSAFCTSD